MINSLQDYRCLGYQLLLLTVMISYIFQGAIWQYQKTLAQCHLDVNGEVRIPEFVAGEEHQSYTTALIKSCILLTLYR